MTLHWHKVNVNKWSTLLKLCPTNADDIVLTFSLCNRCIQTFHWGKLCSRMFSLKRTTRSCIVTSQLQVETFPHRRFSITSDWYSIKLNTFQLSDYAFLYNLLNKRRINRDHFPQSLPKSSFCRISTFQCHDTNIITFDAERHESLCGTENQWNDFSMLNVIRFGECRQIYLSWDPGLTGRNDNILCFIQQYTNAIVMEF